MTPTWSDGACQVTKIKWRRRRPRPGDSRETADAGASSRSDSASVGKLRGRGASAVDEHVVGYGSVGEDGGDGKPDAADGRDSGTLEVFGCRGERGLRAYPREEAVVEVRVVREVFAESGSGLTERTPGEVDDGGCLRRSNRTVGTSRGTEMRMTPRAASTATRPGADARGDRGAYAKWRTSRRGRRSPWRPTMSRRTGSISSNEFRRIRRRRLGCH